MPAADGNQAGPVTRDGGDKGRSAATPAQVPASGWKEIALRTWKEASTDNIGLVAAGVAFYGFLALVPLLGAIVLIYGMVADPATVVGHVQAMTAVLPAEVAGLIAEQLLNVVSTSAGKKGLGVLAALAVTLFGARNAAGGVIAALNIAYEEDEKRGFVKVNALALAMTACAVLVAVVALLAVAAMGTLHRVLSAPALAFALKVLSYAVLAAVAAAASASLYRYGPSRDRARWTWLTPGSVFFALGWMVLTIGFGFYVANLGSYGATYGSLSAVVVLLTWMYLSAYILLFGAELNSELEHQTARDTTAGPERPIGERGAWSADHVAAGSTQAK